MKSALVRLAILAYPRRWRRRYGAELEAVTVDLLAGQVTLRARARVLVDLVANGLDERLRATESRRAKLALTTVAALMAGTFAVTGGLASDSIQTPPNVVLSPTVRLGPGVSIRRAQRGAQRRPGAGQVIVTIPKGPNPQIHVRGSAYVVINPRSGEIVSIYRNTGGS